MLKNWWQGSRSTGGRPLITRKTMEYQLVSDGTPSMLRLRAISF
jgi:hypothetical protein